MDVQLQLRYILKSTLSGLDAVYMPHNLRQSQWEHIQVSLGGRDATKKLA